MKETIDFNLGWGPWPNDTFVDQVQQHCSDRRLSMTVCRENNVEPVIRGLQSGRKRIGLHLDTQADYDEAHDPYARLSYAAKDSGAFVVNEPDHAQPGINKATMHYDLQNAGVPLPYTVVVRNWEPSEQCMTPAERKRLKQPFIIKPAKGYGKQGVARVQDGSVGEIAKARTYDRGDDFLLQELIEPKWFGHRRGWFRVFHVLGQTIPCWWDNITEHYTPVTLDEFDRFHLAPLCEIVWTIARTVRMNFFTTEVAVQGRGDRQRFMAIDYVNDPCDMTPQSHSHCGVPDAIVTHVAERLADAAWRVKKNMAACDGRSIWFPN